MEKVEVVGGGYLKLPEGLLPYLTNEQIKNIYYFDKKRGGWVVPGRSVINCFKFFDQSKLDEVTECVCGVTIKNVYYVKNKDASYTNHLSFDSPEIGCECIENWIDKIQGYSSCIYCKYHRKCNKDHKACTRKIDYKKTMLKAIFNKWRAAESPIMPFGKYQGHTLKFIVKTDRQYALWLFKNIRDRNEIIKYLEDAL